MNLPSKQSAFTLIEVMVGVAIISIALLSTASLQTVAKKSNFDALQRTTARMLAEDIVQRMRSNPTALANYITANPTAAPISETTNTTAVTCSQGSPCTTEEMASLDLYEWEQGLIGTSTDGGKGGLASPSGCIIAGAGANEYVIAIAWRGKTALSDPTANSCGNATGYYDETASDNVYRRLLSLSVIINE